MLPDLGPGGDSLEGGLPHPAANRKRGRSEVPTPLGSLGRGRSDSSIDENYGKIMGKP